MRNLFYYVIIISTIWFTSCKREPAKPYEGTKWRISSYTINGEDSMKTIHTFYLSGEIWLLAITPSGSYVPMYIKTQRGDTLITHEGEWGMSNKNFHFLLFYKGMGYAYKFPKKPKEPLYYGRKPSFKPFLSKWDIVKKDKKIIKLALTQDNRNYTLQMDAL